MGDGYGERPKTYRYGTDVMQVCELWLPETSDPSPSVVVVLHGGFWRSYFGKETMTPVCGHLAANGWAVWNVEYRRMSANGGFPETLIDVAAAIDLLELVGAIEGLELDSVIAIGHSVGAQLALWAVARSALPAEADGAKPVVELSAVVGLGGVVDLVMCESLGLGGHAVHEFLGGSSEDFPERYAFASPVSRLPLAKPVVLVHGDKDRIVPPRVSESYFAQAQRAGDDVRLEVVKGANHYSLIDPDSEDWKVVVDLLPVEAGAGVRSPYS